MTVTTAYSPLTYNGNGSVTSFSVTWPFFLSSDLVVTHISDTGVETVLLLTTNYTVSGGRDGTTGLPGTGTVTTVSTYASGHKIRITRATPKTQQTSITSTGAFAAKTVEAMIDRVHMIAEEGGLGGGASDVDGAALRLDTSGATDFWDGESYIARGFADGVEDDDLATVGQISEFVDDVETAATAAAASASAASSSATTASTAAGTATTAASTATSAASAASDSADAAAASAAAAEAAANGEIGANTILGNNTGSTAAASALSVSDVKTLLNYAKGDIGLGNVDNTSDANKPVSTAQQTALDAKATLAGGNAFTGTATNTFTVSSGSNTALYGVNSGSGIGVKGESLGTNYALQGTATNYHSVGGLATGSWAGLIGYNAGLTVYGMIAASTFSFDGVGAFRNAGLIESTSGGFKFPDASVQTTAATNPVKAWVNFNGQGTIAINASSGVDSITDNGVGDYTVNFTSGVFADANYAVAGACSWTQTTTAVALLGLPSDYTKTATALRFLTVQSNNGTKTDFANVSLICTR